MAERRAAVAGLALSGAVPVLASAARSIGTWRPTSDSAVLLLRARDVVGPHPPRLGMPTSLSGATGLSLHHPGPSELWVLWPAAASGRSGAVVATVAAVHVASIVLAVLALAAAAGVRGAAIGAAALALGTVGLASDLLVDPLNPLFGLLPFVAYLVVLLPVVHRRGRWWAVAAVVLGTLAAQAHLTLAVLVGGVTAVAAFVALPWAKPTDRRPILVAALVGAVLWAPPVVDQIAGEGNLLALATAAGATYDAAGVDHAARVGAFALGRPAWATAADPIALLVRPPVLRIAVAAATAVLLVAVALRARGPAATAARLLVGALVLGAAAFARMPADFYAVAALHNYLWLWPWSAATAGSLAGAATARLGDATVVVGAALVAVAVGAVAVVAPARPVEGPWDAAVAEAAPALAEALGDADVVAFDLTEELRRFGIGAGLVLAAEQDGREAVVEERFGRSFGAHRVRTAGDAGRVDALVVVTAAETDPVPVGARLVAETAGAEGVTTRVWVVAPPTGFEPVPPP